MAAPEQHVYWYQEHWMHSLYCHGIESALKINDVPMKYPDPDGNGMKTKGDASYFYWKPLMKFADEQSQFPSSMDVFGYRLFASMERGAKEFVAVVDVRRDDERDLFRLYAARDFLVGDAILFISEFEESSGTSVLGGIHSRISDSKDDSNAYLTVDRMLRCTREITKGEEIVRWNTGGMKFEYLENIDKVYLSVEKMEVGRLGRERFQSEQNGLLHYSDDTYEVAKLRHIPVYKPKFL